MSHGHIVYFNNKKKQQRRITCKNVYLLCVYIGLHDFSIKFIVNKRNFLFIKPNLSSLRAGVREREKLYYFLSWI
jgi:hypothetical protein